MNYKKKTKIELSDFFKPRSLRTDINEDRRKSNKFNNFHQDYDHTTEHRMELYTYFNLLAKQ